MARKASPRLLVSCALGTLLLGLGAAPAAEAQTIPMNRYYNGDPAVVDHFYTNDFLEIACGSNGWLYEATIGNLLSGPQAGAVALYRYWSPIIGDHFYTTNPS